MDSSETQLNYQGESSSATSNMTNVDVQRPLYTVPGILHFLQHEWTRFEIERQQWETERAEFQVRQIFNDSCFFCLNRTISLDLFLLGSDRFSSGRTTRTRKFEECARSSNQNVRIRTETRKVR